MSTDLSPMHIRVKAFLNDHFPNDNHDIKDYGNDMSVKVGDEPNVKMYFKVLGKTIFDVAVHNDHFEFVAQLLGLDTFNPKSTDLLNNYFQQLNEHPIFRRVFNPIESIDFSQYMTQYSQYEDVYSDIYDVEKKFNLASISGVVYRSIAQFSFMFTAENKLKCFAAIALMPRTSFDFRVAFNLEAQTIHTLTADGQHFDEYFANNKIFDIENDIKEFVTNFVNKTIVKFNMENPEKASSFDLANVSFEDKLELFKMVHI